MLEDDFGNLVFGVFKFYFNGKFANILAEGFVFGDFSWNGDIESLAGFKFDFFVNGGVFDFIFADELQIAALVILVKADDSSRKRFAKVRIGIVGNFENHVGVFAGKFVGIGI